MPCAVIMAGGRGERFWPKSRFSLPKQFLQLLGEKTMLQRTAERLQGIVCPDEIFIITAEDYRYLIARQTPEIPAENIIAEPFGRDTAAAVGLASVIIARKNPCDVVVVLPADHYIADEQRFAVALNSAVAVAEKGEHLVTLGIVPSRPETGYGYIARGESYNGLAGKNFFLVESFTEKPDQKRALQFLDSGNYYWNSGIFIWRVDLIRRLIKEHLPVLHEGLAKIDEALGTGQYLETLREVYAGLPKVSIDYGLMEKVSNVVVIPGDFGWDDVGSWTALEEYKDKDGRGNVLEGRGVLLDTYNTLVSASGKVVATLGINDLIIVEEKDSILVCHKERAQEIKKVILALQENGYEEIL